MANSPDAAAAAWRHGQRIRLRGRLWRLQRADVWPGCVALTLAGQPAADRGLTVLLPFDRPSSSERQPTVAGVSPRRWRHEVLRLDLEATRIDGLDVTARRDIQILPYQLEPVLAVRKGTAQRFLVADAVGMGKTIEAGLVLAELAHHSGAFRGLVVTPAGLRLQWQQELRDRFDLEATVADAEWLRTSTTRLPPGVNAWGLPGIVVTSIDFLRQPEVLAALEPLTWDVVVVDEAHLASAATDRRAAVDAVAARAERLMLLTATPHPGDPAAYRSLCDIGRHAGEAPITLFARHRPPTVETPARRSVFRRVRLTAAEAHVHRLLAAYTAAVWAHTARSPDGEHGRLVTTILRKRALSGPWSLGRSLARRLRVLRGRPLPPAIQAGLPLDDPPATEEDEDPLERMTVPSLPDRRQELHWLEAIAEAARRASPTDSKERWLQRFVARVGEPILVFTEYRDTLERLAGRLAGCHRAVGVLHGGMERADRIRVIDAFNAGQLLLVATDVAAEGLNLHRACRLIVHYELPWALGRLIQRAGRVDRLGQTRHVHEIALVAEDTAERLVLVPLARHALAAAQSGAVLSPLTERQIAGLTMGETPAPIPSATGGWTGPVPAPDLAARASVEAARLRLARTALDRPPRSRSTAAGIVAARLTRRGALGADVYVVFLVTCRNLQDLEVHAEPLVLHLSMHAGFAAPRDSRGLRELCARFQDAWRTEPGALASVVRDCAEQVRSRVSCRHREAADAVRRRLLGIAALKGGAARQMLQPGLFDSRAVRTAAAASESSDRRTTAIADRLAALHPGQLEITTTLRAVLVVDGRRT